MNVTLSRDVEQFLEHLVREGRFETVEEAIREGVSLLKEHEELRSRRLEELRRQVAVGLEQADRGEFVDGDEVFRKLRQKLNPGGNGQP